AWSAVVDDLPLLKDSLYHYIYAVLTQLQAENLLPEIVQIGNETNRGILLSQQINDAGWVLDWDRNSQLFNRAIDAVHDVETASGKDIQIALHVADPEDAVWLFDQFIENGVTDFDIMGISYYWAWHQPTTIAQTGAIIAELKADHPAYEVMIFETGYIWTTASNDNANNIINSTHPAYNPASPDNQRRWLIDLTQEVINSGGKGVIYWEPAWVSSSCWTQWGQGSHQEHATFFDFDNHLLEGGGIAWPSYPYENLSMVSSEKADARNVEITVDTNEWKLTIVFKDFEVMKNVNIILVNTAGEIIVSSDLEAITQSEMKQSISIPKLGSGVYFAMINSDTERVYTGEILIVATK
ncbi:MAG TPA: glycosyl hydrolase 53 family protein, partial [Saprospiraceae bacterium]|nr:glycosyl hydrolase 53 family protein [Saprospiraceae bacterium]